MAISNVHWVFTMQAEEDLSGSQHKAVALDDGKVANNGAEAVGILISKPENQAHAAVAFAGVLKFAAGETVTKDAPLTVTTSGWFTPAGSGDYIVGRAMGSVTSGSNGSGLFNFVAPVYAMSSSFAW